MILPSLAIFRHTEGKTHLVMVTGADNKTMCTRHLLRHGEQADPTTRLSCAVCLKGGWARNFNYSRNYPGNLYVSVASLHGGLE